MSDNLDQTVAEAQSTIEKLEAALREGEAAMSSRRTAIKETGLTPKLLQDYIQTVDPQHRKVMAEMKQEVEDELSRDLPKETGNRKLRLKPARQMV